MKIQTKLNILETMWISRIVFSWISKSVLETKPVLKISNMRLYSMKIQTRNYFKNSQHYIPVKSNWISTETRGTESNTWKTFCLHILSNYILRVSFFGHSTSTVCPGRRQNMLNFKAMELFIILITFWTKPVTWDLNPELPTTPLYPSQVSGVMQKNSMKDWRSHASACQEFSKPYILRC